MIETGLVYIHSTKPKRRFVGCGALIEGGYVATCRHVWAMATGTDDAPAVEIEYPRSRQNGVTARSMAHLVDACEGLQDPSPDLVLLRPDGIPSGLMTLELAAGARFELGEGYAHAGLVRDEGQANTLRDVRIEGTISAHKDAGGAPPIYRGVGRKNLVRHAACLQM